MPAAYARTRSGIGARVYRLRRRHRWTLPQLAARAEISEAYLSQIERGIRCNLGSRIADRLAGALGVTVELLLHGVRRSA